jgi:exodeoxyribonuclease V beta subunit
VFARGCRSGESSGLYAQTWKNYEDLKKEYLLLKKLMRA